MAMGRKEDAPQRKAVDNQEAQASPVARITTLECVETYTSLSLCLDIVGSDFETSKKAALGSLIARMKRVAPHAVEFRNRLQNTDPSVVVEAAEAPLVFQVSPSDLTTVAEICRTTEVKNPFLVLYRGLVNTGAPIDESLERINKEFLSGPVMDAPSEGLILSSKALGSVAKRWQEAVDSGQIKAGVLQLPLYFSTDEDGRGFSLIYDRDPEAFSRPTEVRFRSDENQIIFDAFDYIKDAETGERRDPTPEESVNFLWNAQSLGDATVGTVGALRKIAIGKIRDVEEAEGHFTKRALALKSAYERTIRLV